MVSMTYDLDLGLRRISASIDHVMGASKGHVGAISAHGLQMLM